MSASTSTIIVEYVFHCGKDTHHDLRSKARTISVPTELLATAPQSLLPRLPEWNFDGSSTAQAVKRKGLDTEIIIRPVAVWPHPFPEADIGIPTFVCLCETFFPTGEPTPSNTRILARSVFEGHEADRPWFGMEQEYVLCDAPTGTPLGWPADGSEPRRPQGPYYCGTGAENAPGRKHAMRHLAVCTKMGLKLAGLNAEVMPGQWEFQVGPCEGIEAGDHMLMARWVYLRLLESEGLDANFDAKPKKGDWNGSGMHTNFSTLAMRTRPTAESESGDSKATGLKAIKAALGNLEKTYLADVAYYGSDNNERMTGAHETSKYDEFTWGVGTRHTSCRVPNQVAKDGFGYFEDRRPSSSADPYLVTARLYSSACGVRSEALEKMRDEVAPRWLDANKL